MPEGIGRNEAGGVGVLGAVDRERRFRIGGSRCAFEFSKAFDLAKLFRLRNSESLKLAKSSLLV